MRLPGIGGRRYAVGASVAVSIGSAWTVWCARWIPSVRISHPYPSVRFDAIHPREEPYAEIRSYGSVRGVAGDRYPYRDCSKAHELKCSFRPAATPKKIWYIRGEHRIQYVFGPSASPSRRHERSVR